MKVGDYVRTETGQIGKITYFEGDMVRVDCDKFITYKSNHDEIIKISPNIIDLIEVGDFITFQCISDDYDFKYMKIYTGKINNYEELISFKEAVDNEDFKLISIVTKEQFESMEYKIEED